MKKLLAVIIGVLLFSFTYFGNGFVSITKKLDGDVTVYTKTPVHLEGVTSVLNIEHYMTVAKASQLSDIKAHAEGIIGISIKMRASVGDLDKYLSMYSARLVKAQTIDGVQLYYAYSPRIKEKVSLFGENINIQLAFNNGMMTIGSPIILGGY